MSEVTLVAEGKCEVLFAKQAMADYLGHLNVFLHPIAVLTSKDNRRSIQYRGGVISYLQVKADVMRVMKRVSQQPRAWVTTMIDLYRLPNDFPGYAQAVSIKDPHERVEFLEGEFAKDIGFARFIPYLQLHEFEALIFANPVVLGEYYNEQRHAVAIDALCKTREDFPNAELVNDGRNTAPSKRISAAIPEYESEKATVGPFVVGKIGLQQLRAQCPHFGE